MIRTRWWMDIWYAAAWNGSSYVPLKRFVLIIIRKCQHTILLLLSASAGFLKLFTRHTSYARIQLFSSQGLCQKAFKRFSLSYTLSAATTQIVMVSFPLHNEAGGKILLLSFARWKLEFSSPFWLAAALKNDDCDVKSYFNLEFSAGGSVLMAR